MGDPFPRRCGWPAGVILRAGRALKHSLGIHRHCAGPRGWRACGWAACLDFVIQASRVGRGRPLRALEDLWISPGVKAHAILDLNCRLFSYSQTFHCWCSVAQLCLTLCDPMGCSMPGFPVPSSSPRVCSHSGPPNWRCRPTTSNHGDEVRISTTQISGQPTIRFCPKRYLVQSQGPVRGGRGSLNMSPTQTLVWCVHCLLCGEGCLN